MKVDNTRVYTRGYDFEELVFDYIELRHFGKELWFDRKKSNPKHTVSWKRFREALGFTVDPTWDKTPDVVIVDHDKKHISFREIKFSSGKSGSVEEKFAASIYFDMMYGDLANSIGYSHDYEVVANQAFNIPKIRRIMERQGITITFI